MLKEIVVPDLGESEESKIGEILAAANQEVAAGDVLIVIETSKVAIEVSAPADGVVTEILVSKDDLVEEDQVILKLDINDDASSEESLNNQIDLEDQSTELVVIGGGPGGYSAAFRAADLGKKVILIERYATLGGVCLNVGCIPSKALLHAAKVISESKEMSEFGIELGSTSINTDSLRSWKNKVVKKLTSGLSSLANQRNVDVISGVAEFVSENALKVTLPNQKTIEVTFEHAIIAAGSRTIDIPSFPNDDPRLLTSTSALEISSIPERLLVIGGGIIGLEMATVYHELGASVSIVEFADALIPGADADLVKPLHKRIEKKYEKILLSSKVVSIESTLTGLFVKIETPDGLVRDVFDKVLVAVGRAPNGHLIAAENAGVRVTDRGFILTNSQMKTNVDNIYAIGDIVGQPMLAHKATHEGVVAAEVICGNKDKYFDGSLIPSVAYTDPEIAWVGMTEKSASKFSIDYEVAVFPWAASGRSLSVGRSEGITKIIVNKTNNLIIGVGIVGPNAGELIAEAALAITKGCTPHELAEVIHPHPTLSETVALSAEVYEKTIVDMYVK